MWWVELEEEALFLPMVVRAEARITTQQSTKEIIGGVHAKGANCCLQIDVFKNPILIFLKILGNWEIQRNGKILGPCIFQYY